MQWLMILFTWVKRKPYWIGSIWTMSTRTTVMEYSSQHGVILFSSVKWKPHDGSVTHNCAVSGLVFIKVNNRCIWWSWSTFITSGSDRISCILASSSGEGGTGGCCLALDLSVSPMLVSWGLLGSYRLKHTLCSLKLQLLKIYIYLTVLTNSTLLSI